ncbi:hypothetical protein SMJ63A_60191 [Stenotrophomonas geniculata]
MISISASPSYLRNRVVRLIFARLSFGCSKKFARIDQLPLWEWLTTHLRWLRSLPRWQGFLIELRPKRTPQVRFRSLGGPWTYYAG